MMKLVTRSIIAFLALPGIMAILLPCLIIWLIKPDPPHGIFWLGLIPFLAGTALLLICAWRFFAEGRGTLAPWDPPVKLVHHGVYNYTRNPMYVGVLGMLVGYAILFSSIALTIYACFMALAFHLRIILYEEPHLRRLFGEEFAEYCRRVPRWIPGFALHRTIVKR